MFKNCFSFHTNRLIKISNNSLIQKRNVRIPLWEFLKKSFESRSNAEATYHRKRIGGFQPVKAELIANRTYYWCSCGYAHNQAFCDKTCKNLKGNFIPLKFTSSKFQIVDLCMCKLSDKAPYCDQSCNKRFAGMQYKVGNSVEGTYAGVKEFLNTIPKGVDNYKKYAADRQDKLEYNERLRKKVEEEKDKKFS